jgi:predicted permease
MARDPLWRRYSRLIRPDPESDLADELEFHIQMLAEEYRQRGVPPDEAVALARREFGDRRRAETQCRAIERERSRRQGLGAGLDACVRDLKHALRGLIHAKAFAIVAISTLGLGLGAAVAIFSVVNAVLLRPLPFPEPDRLVRLWEWSPTGETRNPVSSANYLEWQQRAASFERVGGHRGPWGATLAGDGDPTQIRVAEITQSVQDILGARPLAGRLFTAGDVAGGGRAALLDEGFWRDRFGGSAAAIGQAVVLDDISYEIVGVVPAGFRFIAAPVDVWIPVVERAIDPTNRRAHNWEVIGRLEPETPLRRAQAELDGIVSGLARDYPEHMAGWRARVVPLHQDLVEGVRPLLQILLGGVLLVLVIACANVANLLLARGATRRGELAVRSALGAGRGRLVRQLLVEAALLALLAGLAGVGLAHALVGGLVAIAPATIPRLERVGIDGAALAFAAAVTMASAVLFGLAPALRLTQTELRSVLREGGDRAASGRHSRLRGALLVAEVAISLVLLIGAGLLLRSGIRLARINHGFDTGRLLAVSLNLPRARYQSIPAQVEGYRRILEQVESEPGVAAVTSTSASPAAGSTSTFSFAIERREAPNPTGRFDPVAIEAVSDGYFATLGIPVLGGRDFEARDRADAPLVAVVNEALARADWPGQDPVGQRIQFREGQPWIEIVGVVGDTRLLSVEQSTPTLYLPLEQKLWSWLSWQTLLVRMEPGQEWREVVPRLEAAVRRIDSRLAVLGAAPIDRMFAESLGRRRFATVLVGSFAAAALALGLVGLYGVLSSVVAERRREIAIRSALGASRHRVVAMVVGQALGLTLLGVGIGLGGALVLTRLLTALLYQVSPLDPIVFGGVALLLLIVAAVAAGLPARRAALVAPVTAMRE